MKAAVTKMLFSIILVSLLLLVCKNLNTSVLQYYITLEKYNPRLSR